MDKQILSPLTEINAEATRLSGKQFLQKKYMKEMRHIPQIFPIHLN